MPLETERQEDYRELCLPRRVARREQGNENQHHLVGDVVGSSQVLAVRKVLSVRRFGQEDQIGGKNLHRVSLGRKRRLERRIFSIFPRPPQN